MYITKAMKSELGAMGPGKDAPKKALKGEEKDEK